MILCLVNLMHLSKVTLFKKPRKKLTNFLSSSYLNLLEFELVYLCTGTTWQLRKIKLGSKYNIFSNGIILVACEIVQNHVQSLAK